MFEDEGWAGQDLWPILTLICVDWWDMVSLESEKCRSTKWKSVTCAYGKVVGWEVTRVNVQEMAHKRLLTSLKGRKYYSTHALEVLWEFSAVVMAPRVVLVTKIGRGTFLYLVDRSLLWETRVGLVVGVTDSIQCAHWKVVHVILLWQIDVNSRCFMQPCIWF